MPKQKDLTSQIGAQGEMTLVTPNLYSKQNASEHYLLDESRVDSLTLTDYRRMRDNDGEVQMLINAVNTTILSAGFEIEDDPNWKAEEDSEEKQFIEANLLNSAWKGGMSTDIHTINKINLRALEEGYRVYEVVYRIESDGKIWLYRLAPRAVRDSDSQLKLKVDKNGNFIGFSQLTSWGPESIEITVTNDTSIRKALLVVFGSEYGSNYGRSALKPIFYHYDKAHKGMYLNHVGHELGAVKFRKLMVTGNPTDEDKSQLTTLLEHIGFENWAILPKDKYDLTFEDVSDAQVMSVGKEMIDYHTTQMAKAWLAQFIELGVSSKTGARALSQDTMAFFKSGLQSIAATLIENPWNTIIADLVKLNFDRGIYPSLKVRPLQDATVENLFSMFTELIKGNKITTSIQAEIMEKASEKLGLEAELETILAEMQQEKLDKETAQKTELENQKAIAEMKVQQPLVKLAEPEAMEETKPVMRSLYPDEKKVNFVDINRKLTDAKDSAMMVLSNKLSNQRDDVVSAYIKAARTGRKALPKVDIKLAEGESMYSQELLTIANELFNYGKTQAANELGQSVPTTPRVDMLMIEDEIARILEQQTANLKFRLENVAADSIRTKQPEVETKMRLDQEYNGFISKILLPTIALLIPKMFNLGRDTTFRKYEKEIFAFRYTAVLDNRTTEYCRELDGRVFQPNDPKYAMLTPPNHFGCRSIWTPITNQEQAQYELSANGAPTGLPVYSSVSTFEDVQLTDSLEKQIKDLIDLGESKS